VVGGPVEETAPGEYRAGVAPTPAAVAALTAWLAEHDLPLADLRAGRQRLEDVFLRLTAESPTPPAVLGRQSARNGRSGDQERRRLKGRA
jgi:ABC-2 type transport system ATP-binding protein